MSGYWGLCQEYSMYSDNSTPFEQAVTWLLAYCSSGFCTMYCIYSNHFDHHLIEMCPLCFRKHFQFPLCRNHLSLGVLIRVLRYVITGGLSPPAISDRPQKWPCVTGQKTKATNSHLLVFSCKNLHELQLEYQQELWGINAWWNTNAAHSLILFTDAFKQKWQPLFLEHI